MGIVIGVDPDSDKHGIAIYDNGKLAELKMLNTVELVTGIISKIDGDCVFSIENAMANNFCYAMKFQSGLGVAAKEKIKQNRMLKVGRCQHSQKEIMLWLDYYNVPYVTHRPQSGNWADKRELFQKLTGWTGQSNPDTRSASYFGFLAINQKAIK